MRQCQQSLKLFSLQFLHIRSLLWCILPKPCHWVLTVRDFSSCCYQTSQTILWNFYLINYLCYLTLFSTLVIYIYYIILYYIILYYIILYYIIVHAKENITSSFFYVELNQPPPQFLGYPSFVNNMKRSSFCELPALKKIFCCSQISIASAFLLS